METYKFFKYELPYIQQHREISRHIGERTVEIPIAIKWLQYYSINILEVGAVMPWWINSKQHQSLHSPVPVEHIVVDPYDSYARSIKVDIEEYIFDSKKNILSLSTVEHIGNIEYGNSTYDLLKASRVVYKLINNAQNYLLNWPIGYHVELDKIINYLQGYKFMLKQISADNRWEMCSVSSDYSYNHPFKYANAVIFLTNSEEWFK